MEGSKKAGASDLCADQQGKVQEGLRVKPSIPRRCRFKYGEYCRGSWTVSFEEKRQFYEIAHGSVEELQSHLYVALDQEYILEREFEEAYGSAAVVGKLVKESIENLNKQISSRRRDRGRGR